MQIPIWTRIHAAILIVATLVSVAISSAVPLAAGSIVAFSLYFLAFRKDWKQGGLLGGPANIVTLMRLGGLWGLCLFHTTMGSWTIAGLGLLILVADALDGYLARQFGTASAFGANLDKETDAFYVLSFTCLLYFSGYAGMWILALGLLRYAYIWVLAFFQPKPKKETRSFRGQLIAVVLMTGLLLPFVASKTIYFPVLLGISAMVLYSFGASFISMIMPAPKRSRIEKQHG